MKAALVALVAAASMMATPAVAASTTVARHGAGTLSVARTARAAPPASKGEKLGGSGSGRFLIAAAVTAAIVAGIFIAVHETGSDDPDSN